GAGDVVVVEMRGLPAIVADQENAVVTATRMGVGDIGIGALDPIGEVGPHEQVEDAIDRIGRDALAAALRESFSNVVCRGGLVLRCERFEHGFAHVGPLLVGSGQRVTRGGEELRAGMFAMGMAGHGADIGPRPRNGNYQPVLNTAWY